MSYLKLLFAQIVGYRQRKCNESYKEIIEILKIKLEKLNRR